MADAALHRDPSRGLDGDPPQVQAGHPLRSVMDDESWFVTLSTAIGGFIGWRQAKSEVDRLCEPVLSPDGSQIYDVCRGSTDAEYANISFIDTVYPSSILTGLAFGLLAGALLVGAWKLIKMANKSDD